MQHFESTRGGVMQGRNQTCDCPTLPSNVSLLKRSKAVIAARVLPDSAVHSDTAQGSNGRMKTKFQLPANAGRVPFVEFSHGRHDQRSFFLT
jgi:hypothetical protein